MGTIGQWLVALFAPGAAFGLPGVGGYTPPASVPVLSGVLTGGGNSAAAAPAPANWADYIPAILTVFLIAVVIWATVKVLHEL